MLDFYNLKESKNVELKESKIDVPISIYQTISAFANSRGGIIVLGVKENKNGPNDIVGVINPEKEIKDLLNVCSNQTKISNRVIDDKDVSIEIIDGKKIILINVNECTINDKPIYLNGNIKESYIRIGDGDRRATEHELRAMLIDSSPISFDSKVNALGYDFNSINLSTLHSYRSEMNNRTPNNIFIECDDEEFLKHIGVLKLDEHGKFLLTNAGVMMFTDYLKIVEVFPEYLLDFRIADSFSLKWSDRLTMDELTWTGNLFDFYTKTLAKMAPILPSPYYAKDFKDIGKQLIFDAAKESIVNAITNYQPCLNGGIKILINSNGLLVENAGKMKIKIEDVIIGGNSMPRNPSIMLLFRLIGACDRAGTGIPTIFDTFDKLNYNTPILKEENFPDKTSLFLPFICIDQNIKDNIVYKVLIKYGSFLTLNEICDLTGYGRTTVSKELSKLIAMNKIVTNGKITSGKAFKIK